MYFTKEFEIAQSTFIKGYSNELSLITQGDLDWFMVYQALADYYEETLGFSNGGALHIVLSDYNLEDCHIEMCIENCKAIQDAVGLTLCHHLLEKKEETRIFMIEQEWFFRQYVREVVSEVLKENLGNLFSPKKAVVAQTVPEVPVRTLTFTGKLKDTQQWMHSFDGQENWRITFNGMPKLIPTSTFKFSFPEKATITDYIVLDEIDSFTIS